MSFASQLILLITVVASNEAASILAVLPTPSISHQVVFRPLILELVKKGHEVTLVTSDPIFKKGQAPASLTEIDVHDISYGAYKEIMKHEEITTGNKDNFQDQMETIFRLMRVVFERQLLTDEMQSLLKDESRTFDLLILEAYFSPLLALTHVYKNVPVIQISSFGATTDNLRTVGATTHPLIFPTSLQQKVYNHTFRDKLTELQNDYRSANLNKQTEDYSNEMLKRVLGRDVPEISELKNNVDMLFLNVHPVWEMNRPVPPNVVFMGGLHQKPDKELPQDLKQYLDLSKHGVIYVSFGTNVEPAILAPEKIKAMIDAFAKLPHDVLWKWNQDELPGQTGNIKISKWLPQSDLLKHPKVKLFITQGGLQSTDEAITAGVPLIGIPMLGDQWYNVEQYVHHKIGLRVDMDTISKEILGNAIQTILNDESYRNNIVRLRTLMRDQPQTPLERATWWTEYVLRHGGAKHLRSPAANMPWTEYYEIKLLSMLSIGFLFAISIVGYIAYSLYGLMKKHQLMVKVKNS